MTAATTRPRLRFEPFYDRAANRLSRLPPFREIPVTSKAIIVVGVVAVFAVTQIGDRFVPSDRWQLMLLIAVSMLSLQYASHVLRRLLRAIEPHYQPGRERRKLRDLVRRGMGDRALLLSAYFFGTVNTVLGMILGPPEVESGLDRVFVGAGYFVVGGVCGMAVWGIVGVVRIVQHYTRSARPPIDYTSPDQCGGLRFIGDALLRFATVTLLVGVGISTYLLAVKWEGNGATWVVAAKWFWIVFPYLMASYVLFAPAFEVNGLLRQHKHEREVRMADEMRGLRRQLESDVVGGNERETLQSRYDYWQARREQLHKMRLWPFGVAGYVQAASSMCVTAVGTGLGFLSGGPFSL